MAHYTTTYMLVTSYLDIKLTIIPWYGMGPCCTLHRKTANFSDLAYHQLDLLNHWAVEVLEQLGLEHLKHQLLSVKSNKTSKNMLEGDEKVSCL